MATRGFDSAEISSPDGGSVKHTPASFEALPLAQRIRAILAGQVRFFRGGREITMKEALGS